MERDAAETCERDPSDERRDRTVRLLAARLEELAAGPYQLGGFRPLDARVLALEAATWHAVALGVVSAAEAAALWAAAARRHPDVGFLRSGRRLPPPAA